MRGILENSLAGKLSTFQTPKENLFSVEDGPGFTSRPDIIRRIWIVKKKKERFLINMGASIMDDMIIFKVLLIFVGKITTIERADKNLLDEPLG